MGLWVQAGGNPQSSAMAAAVADASSGLNPSEVYENPDGSKRQGLWQISTALGAMSSIDPVANARAAIQLSDGGTDWSNWCSAWSDNACGQQGGTYLGAGSNALASLRQRGGTFYLLDGQGVEGAVGTNASDGSTVSDPNNLLAGSSTDSAATSGAISSGKGSKVVVLLVLALLLGFVWYSMRGKGDHSNGPNH